MTLATRSAAAALALASCACAFAQVKVDDAWARGTVPAQQATGAFMRLTSADDAKLVGVRSPVAGTSELHEMKMEGGVMRMRAVKAIDLPAGKPVSLEPGGYHVMLLGLRQPLKAGETVPVTLTFEGKGGKRTEVEVRAEVRDLTASSPAPAGQMPMQGHSHK